MNLWKRLRRRLEAHPVHTVNPLTGYNRWAPQYSEEDNPIVYLESSALYKMLPDLAGKRVLDVGCGAGRMSKLIAQRGVTYLVGIDFSFYMLCEAQKQLSPLLDTKLVAANVMALPFNNESFDAVISSLVMGHVENLDWAVHELARVARPGSTILISDFHPFGHMLGWKRSFLEWYGSKFEEYCIRNYLHLHEDYFRAFNNAGVRIEEVREPRINDSVKHFFDRTRKGREVYKKFNGFPVVLIFKLVKP